MAKQLTIIRHAKSATPDSGSDRDRPLNARGQGDSRLIGKFFSAQGAVFEQVYCSTAVRARQTLAKINEFLEIPGDNIHFDDALYLASLPVLLSYIENFPNAHDRIVMVGHNPGLTELCNSLCNSDLDNLPTCGVYTIQFPFDDWRAVEADTGESVKLLTPRMLKEVLSKL